MCAGVISWAAAYLSHASEAASTAVGLAVPAVLVVTTYLFFVGISRGSLR